MNLNLPRMLQQYSSLVMCFDSSCNIKWITEGVSKNTWSYSNFDTDRDGNVYFSGGFRDTISFPGHTVITWPGIKDMFFVKLDKNGAVKWVRQTRSSSADGRAVSSDANGNTYVTGYFKGAATFGNYQLISQTTSDMFLARYDSTGACLGATQFANGYGSRISQDASGNPNFIFLFDRTTHVNDSTYTSYGYTTDIVYAQCSAITGMGEAKTKASTQLVIYANPTTGKCNVTIPEELVHEKELTLTVYDAMGRAVERTTIRPAEEKIRLNLEAQAKGIYQVILESGSRRYSGKVVFE